MNSNSVRDVSTIAPKLGCGFISIPNTVNNIYTFKCNYN